MSEEEKKLAAPGFEELKLRVNVLEGLLCEHRRAQEALRLRIRFEDIITTICKNFINPAAEDVDAGINNALQSTGELAGVDRSCIFQICGGGTKMDNTYEWCAPGVEPQIDYLKVLRVDGFPWMMGRLQRSEAVYVPRVTGLCREARMERELFEAQDIRSLIIVPMLCGKTLAGFLGFGSVRCEKHWNEEIIALLKIAGEIFINVLERKRTEEALKKSEKALARAQRIARMGWWEWNIETNEARRSSEMRSILGVAKEELGNRYDLFSHRGPDGRLKFFSTIARDITERKALEKALSESEERFRLIFEQSQDAQAFFGADFCIMDVNPAFVAMFGFTKKELLKKGLELFVRPEDLAQTKKNIEAGSPRHWSARIKLVRKDGSAIIASVRSQKVKLKNGDFIYSTFKDLTEKISLEEQAGDIRNKLLHANKMTSMGTLASGIAHEINNPNNLILFNSEILSSALRDVAGALNEKVALSVGGAPFSEAAPPIMELIEGISDGARRIKLIVENLKGFVKTDAGGRTDFEVNRALAAAAAILNNQITKYTDNFHIDCPEGLPKITGSSQRIEQVLVNIILNALQALPDRTKGVSVAASHDKDAGRVILDVRDEGVGMSADVLSRVTEPFFTTRPTAGGTGLGLSISSDIIKEHNGTIDLHSEPGKGTIVRITLPALYPDPWHDTQQPVK